MKYPVVLLFRLLKRVALYTSAWIEIGTYCLIDRSKCVALYTSAWIEIMVNGCLAIIINVALYTSAWIEMNIGTQHNQRQTCRTLHECVD